jgi:enterochelin esterase-like enzyme
MRPTLFSRLVLAGVFCAAAAGWAGVRLAPPADTAAAQPAAAVASDDVVAAGAQPAVRNRAAWQPSPIPAAPSTPSTQPASAPAPTAVPASPLTRNRAAWQPSPIPSKPSLQQTLPTPVAPVAQDQEGEAAGGSIVAGAAPAVPLAGAGAAMLPAGAPASGPTGAGGTTGAPDASTGSGSAAAASVSTVSGASGLDYIPIDQMFTADKLEALYQGGLPTQRGEWQEIHFYSRALGRQQAYLAWLPPGYESSKQRYPTLYLLHGAGGPSGYGPDEWLGYALTEDLDRLLGLGLIQPMIVILPDGEQGYWMNHADGGPRWADYVAIDLVKDVDSRFRTEPVRERRAIGGLSMGGHGALQLALNHPEVFSIVGAHSPTLRSFEDSPEFFGDPSWFAKYDPLSLARSTSAPARLTIWMDIGNQDPWRPEMEQLRDVLVAKHASVLYHVLEGEHEGWYWEYYLPEYLNFYSRALSATKKTAQGAPVVVAPTLSMVISTNGNGSAHPDA